MSTAPAANLATGAVDKRLFMHIDEIAKKANSISINTRTIKRGDIFIAIKGNKFDGHDFTEQAFKKGASAAIVSKKLRLPHKYQTRTMRVKDTLWALGEIARAHRLKFNIPVLAITGSNGKTTAKEITAHVLSQKFNVLKNETSKNNLIGLPLTLLKLRKKHDIVVLELGMNKRGEIDRLSEIAKPCVGVITNIGASHLEFLKTLKNIFIAKKELLKHLGENDAVMLNADDKHLRGIKKLKCKKIYFGIEKKCSFQAKNISHKNGKWSFSLGAEVFEPALFGKHNIYNALIAIAAARYFGINYSKIAGKIKSFRQNCPMRMELKKVRGVNVLDDSYNSNPLSMERAIDTLTEYDTNGKRIIVSGDMLELGNGAKILHEKIGGLIAARPIGALITFGKLSEFVAARAGCNGMKDIYRAKSHRHAASLLKAIAQPEDVVLVKGSRAMQMEKIIEAFKGE